MSRAAHSSPGSYLMRTLTSMQDFISQSIARLADSIVTAYQENPGMHLEVFVHKADVLSEEYKLGEW
jgi:hypothetical protein